MAKTWAYARVSAKDQNLDRQVALLKQYVDEAFILSDKASGKNFERPKWELLNNVLDQGDTLITPLNNALIMCAIANNGVIQKPYLADHIENYNGGVIKEYEPQEYTKALTEEEANTMKEMLTAVIEEGTGSVLQTSQYTVAGKTGSAEYNSNKDSHAWFVGMSNVEDPDLVVSVLVEDGGSGGQSAAPIAKAVFDSYYNNELNY